MRPAFLLLLTLFRCVRAYHWTCLQLLSSHLFTPPLCRFAASGRTIYWVCQPLTPRYLHALPTVHIALKFALSCDPFIGEPRLTYPTCISNPPQCLSGTSRERPQGSLFPQASLIPPLNIAAAFEPARLDGCRVSIHHVFPHRLHLSPLRFFHYCLLFVSMLIQQSRAHVWVALMKGRCSHEAVRLPLAWVEEGAVHLTARAWGSRLAQLAINAVKRANQANPHAPSAWARR